MHDSLSKPIRQQELRRWCRPPRAPLEEVRVGQPGIAARAAAHHFSRSE